MKSKTNKKNVNRYSTLVDNFASKLYTKINDNFSIRDKLSLSYSNLLSDISKIHARDF